MDLVHRGHAAQVPRVTPYSPLLSIAPWLPAAGATFALGYVAGLSRPALLVAPLSLLLFGLWRASCSLLERRRLRNTADAWIARGHEASTGWYGWRIAELTTPRERKLLARSLRSVVGDLSSRGSAAAAPLNRIALRPNVGLLLGLAERLDALERPVRAAGVLTVQGLITSPDSPLYRPPVLIEAPRAGGKVASECAGRLRAALDGLEVR
jgi:hypothetical protein